MKTKFLILVEASYWLQDEDGITDEVWEQLVHCDDGYMTTITCHHAEFYDNVVQIGDYDFVRDVDGKLYNYAQHYSKMDLIKEFE